MKDQVFQAVQEALGPVLNDGNKHQIATRADDLQKNAKSQNMYGNEGQQDVDMYVQALKETLGNNTINLNVERQLRQRVETLKSGKNPPAPGTSGPGVADQGNNRPLSKDLGSIKGDVQGDVNAQQKQAFEQTDVQGTGGNSPVGGGRSQAAAATNSGNTGAGGPGAGNANVNNVSGAAPTANPNPS